MTTVPSISMVSLGVGDLAVSARFYEAPGWRTASQSQESVRFLIGHNLVLGLIGRSELAEDANVENTGEGFRGVTLAANQTSREAVDAFFARATQAGAAVIKEPTEASWGGYSGYFSDPDGHLWEVAHNPFFSTDQHGIFDLDTPPPAPEL